MTIPNLPIKVPEKLIQKFCKHYKILRLSLYGSILRKDFTSESDVDVLVEFIHGQSPSLFGLAEMQRELAKQLQRKVDMRTPSELSIYCRDRVLQEALKIYDGS